MAAMLNTERRLKRHGFQGNKIEDENLVRGQVLMVFCRGKVNSAAMSQ